MVISKKHSTAFLVIKHSEVKGFTANIDIVKLLMQNLTDGYALHCFRVQIEVGRDFHVLICRWRLAPRSIDAEKSIVIQVSPSIVSIYYF